MMQRYSVLLIATIAQMGHSAYHNDGISLFSLEKSNKFRIFFVFCSFIRIFVLGKN